MTRDITKTGRRLFAALILLLSFAGETHAHGAETPVVTLKDVLESLYAKSPLLGIYSAQRNQAEADRVRASGAFDTVVGSSVAVQRTLLPSPLGVPTTHGFNELAAQATVDTQTRENLRFQVGASTPLVSSLDVLEDPSQPQAWANIDIPLLKLGRSSGPAAVEQQALLHSKASGALFREQRSEVTLQVATAYWRWVASAAQVKVLAGLESLARDQLRDVDVMIGASARPTSDRMTFAAAAENATADRVNAEQIMLDQQVALWTAMGLPPPRVRLTPDEQLPDVPMLIESPPALVAKALQYLNERPLLAYLRGEREAAAVAVEAARIAKRPNLDFGVRAALSRAQLADDPSGLGVGYYGGAALTFSFPLQNRVAIGAYRGATEFHAERALDEQAQRDGAIAAIGRAAADLVSLAETHQRRARATAEFQSAYEAERERYRAGSVTAMDVIVAQQQYTASSTRVIVDRAAYAVALAQLAHETGLLSVAVESSDSGAIVRRLTSMPF